MKRPVLGMSACAAAIFLLLAACEGDANQGIRIGAVRTATVTEVVDAPASVVAKATATVTSPADGRVAKLFVTDGQRVAAGAVLAIIDSPAARQRLAQAEQAAAAASSGSARVPGVNLSGMQAQTDAAAGAAFAQARAAAGQISDPAARAAAQQTLAASVAQYAAARAQAQAAVRQFSAGVAGLGAALSSLTAAQRAQAQAAVTLARQTVDALTLRAPIAGTVQLGGASTTPGGGGNLSQLLSQLPGSAQGPTGSTPPSDGSTSSSSPVPAAALVAPGALVSSGTAVVTLVDVSALLLNADIDETDVLLVKPGVRARVEFDAVPGAAYAAVVSSVDLTPTTSSRGGVSYRARLRLGAGRGADGTQAAAPRPGMSAVAHLSVRTARDALAVPAASVIRVGPRDAVWVVAAGVARRRFITVGTQGDDVVAVTAGVSAGERIVVSGADRVRAGQRLP